MLSISNSKKSVEEAITFQSQTKFNVTQNIYPVSEIIYYKITRKSVVGITPSNSPVHNDNLIIYCLYAGEFLAFLEKPSYWKKIDMR